jgi:hypothetical protein
MSLIGALVSLLRGKQFYYDDQPGPAAVPAQVPRTAPAGSGTPQVNATTTPPGSPPPRR